MQVWLDILSEILDYSLIVIFAAISIVFLFLMSKKEEKGQKYFYLGLFSFNICWSFLHLMFKLGGVFDYGMFFYGILWKTGAIFGIIGLLSLLVAIETYVIKSKYVFTIITFIGFILVLILPYGDGITGARLATYITLPAGAISILILYSYLVTKLAGKPRRDTIYILAGFLILFKGYLLDTDIFSDIPILNWDAITTTIRIIGGMIIGFTYFMKDRNE